MSKGRRAPPAHKIVHESLHSPLFHCQSKRPSTFCAPLSKKTKKHTMESTERKENTKLGYWSVLGWKSFLILTALLGSMVSFVREMRVIKVLSPSRELVGETAAHPHRSMFTELPWIPSAVKKHRDPLLKVYVYDLPSKFSDDINECMIQKVKNTSVFQPRSTKMADIAMFELFKTYPGRVYDASIADVLVVPYPHTSHCLCVDGWQYRCGQVPESEIDELFARLQYYNESTAEKHVWILSGNQYAMNQRFVEQDLVVTGGNLEPEQVVRKDRGVIVIPYLNDKASFQGVFEKPDEWWLDRERKYAFGYVYGPTNTRNSGKDPRKVRVLFQKDIERRNVSKLANMDFYMQAFDESHSIAEGVWKAYDAYENSIFCPVLAGDSCQQARFFDVMIQGCIPVVLNYKETNINVDAKLGESWAAADSSWYTAQGHTTIASLPFHQGLHPDFGVDYTKCVLQVDAVRQEDVYKVFDVMEDVILNHPETIRNLRIGLRACATRNTFGMGSNAHIYDDAFSQVEKSLLYYLEQDNRPRKVRESVDFQQVMNNLNASRADLTADPTRSMLTVPISEWNKRTSSDVAAEKLLKVYVYDLPKLFTADNLEKCIIEIATNDTRFSKASPKLADFVLIRLFETYAGRVNDPADADVFVVPYSHSGHCMCAPGTRRLLACDQVGNRDISKLFKSLKYYNETSARRHIFLMSDNQFFVNRRLLEQPLKIRGGYLEAEQVVQRDRGTIIVPHLNDRPDYQQVFSHPESWWTRDREYAVGFVSSGRNNVINGRDPMRVRRLFREAAQQRRLTRIAGKPFFMDGLDPTITEAQTVGILDYLYENSVFCPMLAANTCQQEEFFDAIMKGCIPVVMNYNLTNINSRQEYVGTWAANETSWYRPKGDVTIAALPFKTERTTKSRGGRIDYESFVLQVDATFEREVKKLFDLFEDLLLNQADRIRELQINLMKNAPKVAFGMGKNAHAYNDAFQQTIFMIEDYLDSLS